MAAIRITSEDDSSKTLTATWLQNGNIDIEIDSPWEGDSETGFGRELSFSLTEKQAQALILFLQTSI